MFRVCSPSREVQALFGIARDHVLAEGFDGADYGGEVVGAEAAFLVNHVTLVEGCAELAETVKGGWKARHSYKVIRSAA
jgi:hypothetical protein